LSQHGGCLSQHGGCLSQHGGCLSQHGLLLPWLYACANAWCCIAIVSTANVRIPATATAAAIVTDVFLFIFFK
jgi:hypothetical protein